MRDDKKTDRPLAGRMVALPEGRQLDLLAAMVEKTGAAVVRCPLVLIRDAPDAAPVEAWLRRLAGGEFDDLILMTGEGMRRLLSFAERAGLRDRTVEALAGVRKITRGPKPVQALREVGLTADLRADSPTTDGVIDTLSRLDLAGRTVGVQLYGQDPNEKLMAFLRSAGATPIPVAPYVYAEDAEDQRVIGLIRDLASEKIDAIAFTSGSQVRRLFGVAAEHGLEDQLREGLSRTRVAAVGPVVAEQLERRSVKVAMMPQRTFFMKPLVTEIIAVLRAS